TPKISSGVECDDADGPVRAHFEVPGAALARPGEYFRPPFPNARVTAATRGLAMGDFAPPGTNTLDGTAPLAPYVRRLGGERGLRPSSAVQFRFAGEIDFASLRQPGAIEWVDITDPAVPQWSGLTYLSNPGRTNYVCPNGLSVRRPDLDPMLPGHTYAVWMTTDVRAASGETIVRADNLVALLAADAPSDPALAAHYAKYEPFRQYLSGVGVSVDNVLNATVFTVATPT